MEGRPHRLALKPFDKASGNDSYLRFETWGDVSYRRIADVAAGCVGCLNWAGSARTAVASGRTGVWTKASIPARARNRVYRP